MSKSRRTKWIQRLERARRGPTTVHQILRQRWAENSALAGQAVHVRQVWREGDGGLRCPDCRHIPLRPWEPVLGEEEFGAL